METFDTSTIGGDFFTRLSLFFSQADPLLILASLLCGALILFLGAVGGRRWLLLMLLLSFVFAGSILAGVDAAATLLRWLALGLLGLNVLRVRSLPGWAWILFCGYVAMGMIWIWTANNVLFTIQVSGVLVIIALAAAALADYASDVNRIKKICTLFLVTGTAWMLIGLAGISEIMQYRLWVERYTAGTASAAVFGLTGAICLPFAVWGSLNLEKRPWRLYSALLAAGILLCLVITGQRAGPLAGLIGCLPLLFLRNYRATLAGGVVIGVGAMITYFVVSMSPQQMEFIVRRYTEEGLNARDVVWATAVGRCMENPLTGAGHGASEAMVPLAGMDSAYTYHGPHNAFLAAWYNTGILGALLLLAAACVSGVNALRVTWRGPTEEHRQMGALLLGALLTVLALSMVTDGMARPSTITTVVAALLFAVIGRLAKMTAAAPSAVQWRLMPVQYPSPLTAGRV